MNYKVANLTKEGQLLLDIIAIVNGGDPNRWDVNLLIGEGPYKKYLQENYPEYLEIYSATTEVKEENLS